jgi:hypothetical protein
MLQDFDVMKEWLIDRVKKNGYRKTAREIGMDHRLVYNLCSGKTENPNLKTMKKINEAMTKSNYSEAPDDSHILDLREKPAILIFPDEQEGYTGISLKTNIGNESAIYKYVASTFMAVSMKLEKTEAEINDMVAKFYENSGKVCGM